MRKSYKLVLKEYIKQEKINFKRDLNSTICARNISNNFDSILREIFFASSVPNDIAIIAVGGYGSVLNAPYSDIDLLFLSNNLEDNSKYIEKILYSLWDTGAKISQSVHNEQSAIDEANKDNIFLTSLLTMRIVCGDKKLFENFSKKVKKNVFSREKNNFILAKLKETKIRHQKYGDSRYLLEPNVKNGKGGLRDLDTLKWITKHSYGISDFSGLEKRKLISRSEKLLFEKSHEFLWKVRLGMHFINNKADENLSFAMQTELSKMFGYKDSENKKAVEIFMSDYISVLREVSVLTRLVVKIVESEYSTEKTETKIIDDKFKLINLKLSCIDDYLFDKQPSAIFDLFYLVATKKYKIHYSTYKKIRNNNIDFSNDAYCHQKFIEIITCKNNVEKALRTMNSTGILQQLIPEWSVIFCQIQYDMYHSYTTDEHTIRAVGLLSKIDSMNLKSEYAKYTSIISNISNKEIIYIAVLLHDIGKGLGGDHSIKGAQIASSVCKRFGFNKQDTEKVIWLIKNHLSMSNVIQRRDLGDFKTILDFARKVRTTELLDLLKILTFVDIKSVSPNAWNKWKQESLNNLYDMALKYLSNGNIELVRGDIEKKKKQIIDSVCPKNKNEQKRLNNFIKYVTPQYLLKFDTEIILWQVKNIIENNDFIIDIYHDEESQCSQIFINRDDKFGLMADITGAISIMGANIIQAQIHTFNKIGAVNIFYVQNLEGKIFDKDLCEIKKVVNDSIMGKINIDKELIANTSFMQKKEDSFKVAKRVHLNNTGSDNNTIIEIKTKDAKNLLYKLSRTILDLGLKIETAKTITLGEQVYGVFYIKDGFGLKLYRKQAQNIVTKQLNSILEKIENENN